MSPFFICVFSVSPGPAGNAEPGVVLLTLLSVVFVSVFGVTFLRLPAGLIDGKSVRQGRM